MLAHQTAILVRDRRSTLWTRRHRLGAAALDKGRRRRRLDLAALQRYGRCLRRGTLVILAGLALDVALHGLADGVGRR